MWQLDGSKARLESSQLRCHLDLAEPSNGLSRLTAELDSKKPICPAETALMQVQLASGKALLADAYIRGNDLVATYSESVDHPCRTQVYWRLECEADFYGIQLIVSVQTSRLEAAPNLVVASRLPAEVRLVEEGVTLVALPNSDVYYAELADGSNVESTVACDAQVIHKLFPGALEKGVIRRARILGCFLAASSAEQSAKNLQQRFARSALPLTT